MHHDKISYNFNFSEWIKLSATNDIKELKRISEIGLSISDINKFSQDIVYRFGLKAFAISNVDKDMICTYTRPTMSTNIGCCFIYDNDEILVYIGKSTSDLLTRACVSAVQRVLGDFSKIELLEFNTKSEAIIFEIYYISKLKPKFNSESNTKDTLPFDLPDTSISRKYINSVEKKIFDSKDSPEFISYKEVGVHLDADLNLEKHRDRSTNTREQVSKLTGVSTGNIARYDAVMKSDNEELKKKVQTGEVKIGTAYREIKDKEKNPIKNKETNTYKEISLPQKCVKVVPRWYNSKLYEYLN